MILVVRKFIFDSSFEEFKLINDKALKYLEFMVASLQICVHIWERHLFYASQCTECICPWYETEIIYLISHNQSISNEGLIQNYSNWGPKTKKVKASLIQGIECLR